MAAGKVLTLADMRQLYRTNKTVAEKCGIGLWFFAAFGSETDFLSQFKPQTYDGGN